MNSSSPADDFADHFPDTRPPTCADATPRDLAAAIVPNLRRHFPADREQERNVLALAEEVGEFIGAWRRWAGLARRSGPWSDVEAELADVALTAYVTAAVLGIDLDAACRTKAQTIFTRGWRDAPHGPDIALRGSLNPVSVDCVTDGQGV